MMNVDVFAFTGAVVDEPEKLGSLSLVTATDVDGWLRVLVEQY